MARLDRPTQISMLLKTMILDGDNDAATELELYIADLEAKQPDRPERIGAILKDFAVRYPAEAKASLEAYISELEANQQPVPSPGRALPPTESLYWRSVKREKERKARALRKQNNYQ